MQAQAHISLQCPVSVEHGVMYVAGTGNEWVHVCMICRRSWRVPTFNVVETEFVTPAEFVTAEADGEAREDGQDG